MKKLYVQNESPIREERVSLADKTSSMIVAFILPQNNELKALEDGFLAALKVAGEAGANDKALQDFLCKQIRYVKDANLQVFDSETEELVETIAIADSRVPPTTEYWDSAKTCREVLLDAFFNSVTWRAKIFDAYNTFLSKLASGTLDVKEAEIKN